MSVYAMYTAIKLRIFEINRPISYIFIYVNHYIDIKHRHRY